MSNLWINIRFGTRFLQVGPNTLKLFTKGQLDRSQYNSGFTVYQFFGYSS